MSYKLKLRFAISGLFLFGVLALSPLAFGAALGQTVNDDSTERPIDTHVTQSEALNIARQVLESVRSIGTPSLLTEEDGQIMWRIPYESNNGTKNEIIINTATGAYRLVVGSDAVENADDMGTSGQRSETNSTQSNRVATTAVTPVPVATTTSPLSLEDQIIRLLERIISLLRTQLLP